MNTLQELAALSEALDRGNLLLLQPRLYEQRILRSALSRFSEHVYFFPFGVQPDQSKPMTIFVNGLLMYGGHDFVFRTLGEGITLVVVVFEQSLTQHCNVQATFDNIPVERA